MRVRTVETGECGKDETLVGALGNSFRVETFLSLLLFFGMSFGCVSIVVSFGVQFTATWIPSHQVFVRTTQWLQSVPLLHFIARFCVVFTIFHIFISPFEWGALRAMVCFSFRVLWQKFFSAHQECVIHSNFNTYLNWNLTIVAFRNSARTFLADTRKKNAIFFFA